MAIATLKHPIDRLAGKLTNAGTTEAIIATSSVLSTCTLRRHSTTVKPPTTTQRLIRTKIGAAAQAYKALTTATAAAWRTAALEINRRNSLGTPYTFTGINLFQQVNLFRQLDGLAITSTVPNIAYHMPLATSIYSIDYTAPIFRLVVLLSQNGNGCHALLRLSNSTPTQARQIPRSELKIPGTSTTHWLVTITSSSVGWLAVPNTVSLTTNEWCALEVLILSPDYLPAHPWFVPLVQI